MIRIKRFALGVLVGAPLAFGGFAHAELKSITIGTNPAGSVFFLLGSGFAKVLQEKLKIRSTAQPHTGSSVYLPLMDKGEITLGINSSLDSGLAFGGKEPFQGATRNVRAIARIWILPYGYVVKDDSGIRTIADLKGKRVITDLEGVLALSFLNRAILNTAGLRDSDVEQMRSQGVVQGISMVAEGRVDATPVAMAMPALLKSHATVPGGFRIVALGPEASDAKFDAAIKGARTHLEKPRKARPFVKGDTLIAAFDAYLNAGASVSDADALRIARTIHENWAALQKDYPPLRAVKAAELAPADNPIPFHPGAVKYYKKAGVWSKANDAHEATLK